MSDDSTNFEDFYHLLGVGRTASPLAIRKAYRQLVLEYHPDRNPGDAAAEERFKKIAEAYQTLSTPEKRAQYDLQFAAVREAAAGASWKGFEKREKPRPSERERNPKQRNQWKAATSRSFTEGNEFEASDLICGIALGAMAYLLVQKAMADGESDVSFWTTFFAAFLAIPAAPMGYSLGTGAKAISEGFLDTLPDSSMILDGMAKLLPLAFSVGLIWLAYNALHFIGWEIPTPTLLPCTVGAGFGSALGSAFGRAFTSVAERPSSKLFGMVVGAVVGGGSAVFLTMVASFFRLAPLFEVSFFEQAANALMGAAIGAALASAIGSLRSTKR